MYYDVCLTYKIIEGVGMNDKLTPHGMNFPANRPVIMGRNGMVCAGHPLASQAGITTLQKGNRVFPLKFQ